MTQLQVIQLLRVLCSIEYELIRKRMQYENACKAMGLKVHIFFHFNKGDEKHAGNISCMFAPITCGIQMDYITASNNSHHDFC